MKNLWFVPSVRRVVRPCVFFSLFLTIIGFGAATRTLQAQNAHFAGAQTAVGSGFSAPAGIAVDAAGNVYVADSGAGKVIRIPATDPTCSTLSDCTSVGTGLVHPRSVVLDASGNVYIADQGTNLVTKVLATDLTCATAGDCTNVGPALSSPEGVAVDANNNVYIADEGNARVLYVPAADLSCATPSDCKSVGTGLTAPAGVGVDRLNNIYIADTASTTILKVPSSDLACTTAGDCTTVGSGFSSPFDVAVNFNGDVFVADTGNNRIVKVPSSDLTCATVTDCKTVGFGMNQPTAVALTQFGNVYAADFGAGQALQVQVAGVNLGTINVGSTSGSVALTFTFDASVTLNSTTAYQVLTQGATGLDFKDAGSGTCATSSSFTVGQTCTVNVHFSPASPGLRLGSVALYDSTGNTLATANLFGTGSGPQAVFYPGTQSTILNPIPGAAGVAVDAAGNIYVTSYSLGNLYKITQSGGVYSASTIATGLSTPLGIAVDGMGNVFVATGNGVLKFTPSGGTYTQSSIVARTSYLVGVAVDQYGNIYYTDLTGSAVFRLLLSNGTYTSYSVGTSWAGPYGIAVDPSGNVYVSDYDSHAFYKETLGTNSFYTLSTIFSVASTDYPTSVALDASGNIYAAVLGGSIYRESPSGGGYTQTVVAATTTPPVYDVALDNSGNLYFTYENPSFSTDGLYEINVNGQPPLSLTFNNTAVNATSSDSPQGFSVWNIGNAPLIFTTPGTGTNPSYPTDFPDNSADTQLCTAASPLESAGFCDVSIDFSPLSSGSHNETVTLVDNTLNGTNATQSIAVSGTATGVSITLSPSSLAAETFNTAISPVTFAASGGTAPYTFTVVSGSLPPGVALASAGVLSGTPTSAGSYTFSVQAEDASSNIGSQAYSVTVNKAAPTLVVSNSPVTYTGSAQSATINPSTPGTVSNVQYNGSSTVPTAAGTYAVTADFAPTDTTNYTSLTGAAAGNFVIGQATPTLAVSNSPVTYSGSAQAATITPSVPGTVSAILYNGSSTVPTSVGTYAVTASFTPTDTTNYATLTGASAGSFVINKATPTLSVSNPSVPYTGTAQTATVVGSVPGTVSAILYNGSSTAPTTAGTYAVTASFTPTDTTNYATLTGASAGSFVINKATPTLSVSNPSVPYTGTAQAATVIGSVPGTVSAILYNGSSTVPASAGTYAVTASFTPTDTTDYATLTGASAGNFVINKATPTLSVSNPSVPYTGTAQTATVVGSVPGTVSAILYNGSSTAPTTAGTYAVTASFTPTDTTNYATLTGASAGSFVINKATPTLSVSNPSVPYTGTAQAATVVGSVPGTVSAILYNGSSTAPTTAGTYAVTASFTPTDTTNYATLTGASAGNFVINKTTPTLSVSNPSVPYTGTAQAATVIGSVPGTVSAILYNGSSTAPTTAGTYAVTASFTPTDTTDYATLTGASAGSFVINKATPTLSVSNPSVPYTGTAQAATVVGSVPGTVSAILYNGSSTVPTSAGTYAVTASFAPTDTTDYASLTGASAGNFVINKATPTLSVSNPSVPYTGAAQAATVAGSVPGTVSAILYNGSSTVPTSAGTYAVTASFAPTDTTDYATLTGASAGNFVINKTTPTLSVSNPSVPYTGSAQAATVIGSVPGTVSAILYNGSSTVPTSAGTYAVTASFAPTDTTDYATLTGASAGNFVINKTTPTLSVSNPSVPYTGSAQAATVIGSVPGTVSAILYNGSSTAPTTVGTYTITASYTPTDSTDYATLTGAAAGTFSITKATPTITWATPAGIAYGTALSSTQLDATSTVAGNLVYTPAAGSIPLAGTQTLSVTLTPTDTTDYNNATQTVQLVVSKASPSITWATPAAITYGTALGAAQLNASSTVAGTLVYTPAAGTVLGAGTQTLSVTLTPTDAADYATATQTVQLVVNKAAPAISWPAPAAINYGTALSATQLDATSTVAGAFVYTPTAGTVLSAGTQTLSVTLTPTDGTDYTSATQTVQLVVNKAGAPTITWSSPAAITYGTALNAAQLDASSTVAGTFVYTPAAGTVLNAGTQTLSVTLNPTDSTDYPTSTQTVQIVVNKATPTVTWATPAAITYGTALSAAQLNASGSVPGTLVYTPAAGTLLTAGLQTLSVTFTPTDSTDYSTVTQTVQLQVNKVAPSITWATPAAITYGTALSATQLDATATVPGTFDYTPSSGTVLSTGTQTLSVTFTPSDTTDYSSVTQTVQLTVKQATAPSITWAAPAAITYGTALGATQLDASATIPGAFVYSPAAGTVLAAGLQTLSVTFTPTDTTDYPTATQTVQITVNKANPSITWAVPAAISYGTALGATQLDASSTVAGAFVYTPAAGTVLNAGTQTLSVTLTPTDNNDYNQATQTVSLTVNKAAQTITFTPPAAVAFGSAPITLTATGGASGNPVTFTLVSGPASLAGSTLSFTGIGTVVVDANEAGNANYLAATQVSQSINVTNAALTVTANNVSRVYGAANPTFTGSVSGAVNGDAFTETFSTTATASSPVGSYPIVPAVTGTDLADYTVTVQNGTLNVTQAGTSTTLAVSSSSINPGQSVTLTATVASATSGTPTGSVSFYDGSTLLGTGTLASGAATYAAAGLQSGSHTITAVYAGDTNFTGSSTTASTTIVVAALDFTLTVTGGSDETIKQGGDAYYQLQVNPTFGNYPGTVSFTATGLPAGATIIFSPSTVPVNGGQQSVTATVVTAPGVGANVAPSIGRKLAPLGLALFLLPLAGARRMRRFGRGMSRLLSLLLLLAGLATAAAVSGCGGSVTKTTSPQTYTIGITATGGNAQHSVNVTLEIN